MSNFSKASLFLFALVALPSLVHAVPVAPGGAAPEPATMLLLGAGAGAVGVRKYLARRAKRADKNSDRK